MYLFFCSKFVCHNYKLKDSCQTLLISCPPQRPTAEPAAGAAEAAASGRGARGPERAGAALPPRAALAAGRLCRRHAATLHLVLINLYYKITTVTAVLFFKL